MLFDRKSRMEIKSKGNEIFSKCNIAHNPLKKKIYGELFHVDYSSAHRISISIKEVSHNNNFEKNYHSN